MADPDSADLGAADLGAADLGPTDLSAADLAARAWAFIAAQQCDDGPRWWIDDTHTVAPTPNLYHGGAGIALFALDQRRRDQRLAEVAIAGACRAGLDALAQETRVGPMNGLSGVADTLLAVAEHTGDAGAGELAARLVDRIVELAVPCGAGIGWVEPMPFANLTGVDTPVEIVDLEIGAAGAMVVLLRAHHAGHRSALAAANAVAERLIELAEPHPAGHAWYMAQPMPWPFPAPNLSHGGVGVGLAFTQLFRTTGDRRLLDLAASAADFALAHSVPCGNGRLIAHRTDADPPRHYLGACHGPAGTGRLLDELHALTGDARWGAANDELWRGLLATGAPEQRTPGLWANYSQCCGDAGIGEFALWAWQRRGEERWLTIARRCAASIAAQATLDPGGGASWLQAEHRTQPRFVQRQTGYQQGAAGIGAFLGRLAAAEDGRALVWHTSDWPAAPATRAAPATPR